jgi:hypothetical protein
MDGMEMQPSPDRALKHKEIPGAQEYFEQVTTVTGVQSPSTSQKFNNSHIQEPWQRSKLF